MRLNVKYLFLTLYLLTQFAFAQKEKNIWYFGNKAGLDFNSGNPVVVTNGKTAGGGNPPVIEGTAVVSDSITGQLLFYTDGVTVWNKQHNVMVNGDHIDGWQKTSPFSRDPHSLSSTQAALIVPMPGNSSKYYIFCSLYEAGTLAGSIPGPTPSGVMGGITYAIVDLSLNGGNGQVISKADIKTQVNILLQPSDEKITAIQHCNQKDWWVITRKFNSNTFYAYPLTSTGIGTPVISNAGTTTKYDEWSTRGYLKASSDGKKLAMVTYTQPESFQLFDFCSANGTVSNAIVDNLPPTEMPYGLSFSPDNSKVFITTVNGALNWNNAKNCKLYQYDISSGVSTTILASKTLIANANTGCFFAIQQASNGKLYMIHDLQSLDVINNPNAQGSACNYVANAVNLAPGNADLGLPNFVEAQKTSSNKTSLNLGNDTTFCVGSILLDGTIPNSSCASTTYLWNTGATTSQITVSTSGKYWVTASNCSNISDTIEVLIGAPQTKLPADVTVCNGQITLDAGYTAGATYSWNTGATTQVINATTAGQYIVQVSLNGCSAKDTINVKTGTLSINLGKDVSFCTPTPYNLDAGVTGASYLWSTGETTQTITVNNAGTYFVTVNQGGCKANDTITVSIGPLQLNLGNDTTLCGGQKILNATTNGATYLWNTGATTPTITATTSGNYSVTVTQGTCTATDNINVTFSTSLNVNLGNDTTFCSGAVLLDAKNPGADYVWSTGASTQTISVSSSGTYWVKTFKNNCWITDTIKILTATPVDPLNDVTICESVDITLDAQNPGASYLWSTGSTDQIINVMDTGMYWVRISFGSCKINDTANVTSNEGSPSIFVPNAFTPNKNGLNEIFNAKTNDITEFELNIFNRWGELIFKTKDQNQGWDGKINGRLAQQDVYVWVIDYTVNCPDTRNKRKVGHVSLLR